MNKQSWFLVTTADKQTWRRDLPTLFLGEWCNWENDENLSVKTEIAKPYGLEKKQKNKDMNYLYQLNELLLIEITNILNKIHGVNHTTRYWRILLGTWLQRFVLTVFNRWAAIQQVTLNYNICDTVILDISEIDMIPMDYLDFCSINRAGQWDHYIYSRIIKECTNIEFTVIAEVKKNDTSKFTEMTVSRFKKNFKYIFILLVNLFSRVFTRSNDAFIISSYMSTWQEIKLQLALGQIFCPRRSKKAPSVEVDLNLRSKIVLPYNNTSGFEKFIRELISNQIPLVYLEGYNDLIKTTLDLTWPSNPKFIFTSNNFDGDEVFKAWTANHVENGVPYFIGQHGANYGTAEYAISEVHEVATSDYYLTWGWRNENNIRHKYIPVSAFPLIGRKKINNNSNGGLLLVEKGNSGSTYPWDSIHLYKQYLREQVDFIGELPSNIRRMSTVRLYSAYLYLSWSEEKIWKREHPEVNLECGKQNINSLISENRLVVYSYNSTGLLESLFLNIPTLCFWDIEKEWEIRESAMPYFDQLKDVGVFHNTPKSIANKVNEIWDDVDGWWYQEHIQKARRIFCEHYVHMDNNPIIDIKRKVSIKLEFIET